MKAILSLAAAAALALTIASPARAAGSICGAYAQMKHQQHHRTWSPKKHYYGKRMRARWGAGCKMSGSC
jgi:hypothetical protein